MREAVRAEFQSTDDARVDNSAPNNQLRHSFRVLSDAEKQLVSDIKDKGQELLALMHQAGCTRASEGKMGSRELSIAQTKTEEAVMWAVKHVTR